MTTPIYEFVNWGLIDYQEALVKQLELAEETANQNTPGTIVFCSHPEIVTLGSKTQVNDVTTWDGPIAQISRGGRATYHGPSQLVVYPIINLNLPSPIRPAKDIHVFLRNFEDAIVKTLADFNVEALGKSLQKKNQNENETDETGVWVKDRKIASLGIQIKRWVTLHGAAINLEKDPLAFRGIKPCGFTPERMISVEEVTESSVSRDKFTNRLFIELSQAI